jgi:hypothetical protein
MAIITDFLKTNLNIIDISLKKKKINNNFLNNKFIIFFNVNKINYYSLKNYLLKKNILNYLLKSNDIKSVFNFNDFNFLKNSAFLCIFINDIISFINVITFINEKQFFFFI